MKMYIGIFMAVIVLTLSQTVTAEPEMVLVKGGCFQMGDIFGEGLDDTKPVHEVCLDDFYIGKYEVTLGEFRSFVNDTGYKTEGQNGAGTHCLDYETWRLFILADLVPIGFSHDDNHPVVGVSWNDTQEYIKWLNKKSGKGYRLLTEAEWEYAARSGGKKEKYAGFSDKDDLYRYANFCDDNCVYPEKTETQDDGYKYTSPVGSYKPNGLGIYDMTGNLCEWVQDIYSSEAYSEHQRDNPVYTKSAPGRVYRDGSFADSPSTMHISIRLYTGADMSFSNLGFRLALSTR